MGVEIEKTDALSPKDRLLKAVQDEEDRGMAVTRAWCDLWQENLRYFFSVQLAGGKRHKDWDWIVINYLWPSSMQEAAKISRQEPVFVCDPWEEGDADAAEAWQGWLQWTWDRGLNDEGMAIEQLKAILCGKIWGYRVYKVYWEPRSEWDPKSFPPRWVGDVKGKLWKPSLFWATGEENINDGSCGTMRYVDLNYALARWPDYSESLRRESAKTTAEIEEAGGGPHIAGQTGSSGLFPATGPGGSDRGTDTGSNKLLDRVLDSVAGGLRAGRRQGGTKYVKISEIWFKDYTELDKEFVEAVPAQELADQGRIVKNGVQIVDPATGELLTYANWPQREPVKWKEPVFPNGRYILRAGDTILNEDEEDQKYPYRLWPFVTSPHYIIPFMWQGSDAVQLNKTAQDMINVSVSHLVNYVKQFGDPKIAIERGAIDSPKSRDKRHFRIGAGAGSIIRLVRNGLAKFKILDPPQLSPVVGMLYQIMSQEFKNMCGLQDIAQGKKSAGDLTATESQYLAMSAGDRIQLQTVIEKSWIERIGVLAAQICQQHYEPERLVRILGENAIPGVVQITQRMKDVRYDIHVQVGSSLPFDAEKRIARYLQANSLLMQPPSPMLPELLRVLEIPNWRKILQRHAVWVRYMEFQAMVQQMSQQIAAGQVLPEQAVQALTVRVAEMVRSAAPAPPPQGAPQAGPKPPQPQPQGQR